MKRKILLILSGIIAVFYIGDAIYASVIMGRYQKWELEQVRDAEGVREGAKAFTLGEGTQAVLLIHGFADSPYLYHKMAPVLAEAGFTCRALRLPGFAEPLEASRAAGLADWRACINTELEKLHSAHPDVFVVAHSLGAALLFDHLASASTPIKAVSVLTPLLQPSSKRSLGISPGLLFRFSHRLLFFTHTLENVMPMNTVDSSMATYPRDPFIPKSVYVNMFTLLSNLSGAATSIQTPCLMILAEEDRVIDNAVATTFFNGLPVESKLLLTYEHSGHPIPIDSEWRRATQDMISFFKAQN